MKRTGLIVALGCLLLVMYFHQGVTASPAARLITVYGVVDGRHLYDDRFGETTIDKAIVGGHIYSDKAPLPSFLVLPFYWAKRALEHGPRTDADGNFAIHVADVVVSAIPFSLFGLALHRRLARVMSPARASWTALGALFGTCLYGYGNIYYGHMLAGALFLAAYALSAPAPGPAEFRPLRIGVAGLAGGLAVLTEYPLVLPVAVLFASFALQPRRFARAFAFGLGALGPAGLVLLWNRAVTGHALDFPYSHVTDQFAQMRTAFGVRLPDPEAGWELLFGQYRGMFFYAPPLLVVAPLAFLARRSPVTSPSHESALAEGSRWLLAALCVTQFLFVSSYFKWDGGWCVGPRHLATVMMLLLYEGTPALARASTGLRRLFAALCAIGITVNITATATEPVIDEKYTRPFFEVFWQHASKGDVHPHNLLAEAGLPVGRYLFGVWGLLFVLVACTIALVDRRGRRARDARMFEAVTPAA